MISEYENGADHVPNSRDLLQVCLGTMCTKDEFGWQSKTYLCSVDQVKLQVG